MRSRSKVIVTFRRAGSGQRLCSLELEEWKLELLRSIAEREQISLDECVDRVLRAGLDAHPISAQTRGVQ